MTDGGVASDRDAGTGHAKRQNRCPRCGGSCGFTEFFKENGTEPSAIEIRCPKCGTCTARFDEKDGMWYVGDMHYIPEAEDDIATRYHEFKVSDYPDDETAVCEGIRISDGYEDACERYGVPYRKKAVLEDSIILFERAVELGMYDYAPELFSRTLIAAFEDRDWKRADAIAEFALRTMKDLSARDLFNTEICCTMVGIFDERVRKIMECASLCMYNIVAQGNPDPVKRIEELEYACTLFELNRDPIVKDLAVPRIEAAKSIADEALRIEKMMCAYAFGMRFPDLVDSKEVMKFADAHRDLHPSDYMNIVFRHVRLKTRGRGKGRNLERIDFCIGKLIEDRNGDVFGSEHLLKLSTAYIIRNAITGDVADLTRSVDAALDSVASGDRLQSLMMVASFIADERMPHSERDRVLRRIWALGIDEGEFSKHIEFCKKPENLSDSGELARFLTGLPPFKRSAYSCYRGPRWRHLFSHPPRADRCLRPRKAIMRESDVLAVPQSLHELLVGEHVLPRA